MPTGATGQLGLALPVQGELSGTWGNTVNNGITQYTNIAIAATLTLTNDGAVTLANTTGDASASNITSTLTGAGTVTAQFAIVRVTGTLTTAKVVTAPSYSKTYVVVNAATGGIVTFKASGQTGVSIAVGESAWVYFNGTDYVKLVGTATAGAAGGSTTQVQFNSSGVLAGSANMTFDGTSMTLGGNPTLSAGTANGVTYLNGSKVLTSGSAIVFDGTNLGVGTASPDSLGRLTTEGSGNSLNVSRTSGVANRAGWISQNTAETIRLFSEVYGASATNTGFGLTLAGYGVIQTQGTASNGLVIGTGTNDPLIFGQNDTESMRLTSTGLGIGTSSPGFKLDVNGTFGLGTGQTGNIGVFGANTATGDTYFKLRNTAGAFDIGTSATGHYFYGQGSLPLQFFTNATERARIDSSGNLGLGVTPSAWDTAVFRTLQVGSGAGSASLIGRTDGVQNAALGSNFYYGSGSFRYIADGTSTWYNQQSGVHAWFSAGSGTAGNAITFTQAMTLDASGNLGIGATSPTYAIDVQKVVTGGNLLRLKRSDVAGEFQIYQATNAIYLDSAAASGILAFSTVGVERARIDAVGNVLVGGTAARGTTVGTAHLDLFNGTAPAGTLTNGVSLYSSSGDLKFMNAAGDAFDVGYRNIPQNAQTGNYTLTLADSGDHIFHASGAGAATYTIPANSSVAFPIGTAVTFINMSATSISIAITTDTMYLSSAGTTGTRTLAQYGSATAIKVTSTNWLISGSGLT